MSTWVHIPAVCSTYGNPAFTFQNKVQAFFFDVSVSTKFELAIIILIFLNMVAMAVEHYRQSQAFSDGLEICNIVFTTVFTLEAIVKIIGMRWHYFRRAWNVFDFLIVILAILGKKKALAGLLVTKCNGESKKVIWPL